MNKLSFTGCFFLPFFLRNVENKIKLWKIKCSSITDEFQALPLLRLKTYPELMSSISSWINFFFLQIFKGYILNKGNRYT